MSDEHDWIGCILSFQIVTGQGRFDLGYNTTTERMIVYNFNRCLPLLIAKTGQIYTVNETC